MMPRPDLEKLGVKYRRIPILAIGRDIYLDTRLILRKLEDEFPHGQLGSDRPEDKFVEKLLEKYMIEGPVFAIAAGLVPTDFVQDPKFAKDRAGFCGREWTPEVLDKGRPECLAYVRNLFKFLETTILADGRKWLLKSEKPSLADIEGEEQYSYSISFFSHKTALLHIYSERWAGGLVRRVIVSGPFSVLLTRRPHLPSCILIRIPGISHLALVPEGLPTVNGHLNMRCTE